MDDNQKIDQLEAQLQTLHLQIEKLQVLANKQQHRSVSNSEDTKLQQLEEENAQLKKELEKLRYQRLHLIRGLEELRRRLDKVSST
ncbi:hypothetical protein GAYE_SCF43G5627 [Galdieria yellowstonensis]|uniref:Uncharacterized protein n=1 Tax=Galdieria yellowstonensis TaxID=3028027 RepID=A0AAV9IKF9_9RHOD|nr:hypothetical protein GAYE_SCF43G5627 [Galdieria yellowstonensis]